MNRSIAAFGICVPILIDADGSIVHGHGVWEAARRAGLEMVPVIEISHLPPEKLRLLAVTLNRIAETGKWDEHALAQELEELLDLGEDILVTGFEMAEVDTLIFDETASEDEGIEDLPACRSTQSPGLAICGSLETTVWCRGTR